MGNGTENAQHEARVSDLRPLNPAAAGTPGARPAIARHAPPPVRRRSTDLSTWIVVRRAARIIVPAAGLFATLALMYLYRDEPLTFFDRVFAGTGAWLSAGAVCVPLTFFAVHLTSRRYGAAVAAGQVLLAWVAVAIAAMIYPIEPDLELGAADPARVGLALPVSLLLAHLVAIVTFDATRSIRWWQGPLHGFAWASVVFAITFYPATYLGSDGPWLAHMGEYLAVLLMVSVGLLVPYWLARPIVRPLPGLAGY